MKQRHLPEEDEATARPSCIDVEPLHAAFARTAGSLVAMIQRITGDRAEAEDIVQDVFVDLWRRPDLFDPARGSLTTLLHVRCRGVAIDRLRSRTRRHRRESFVAVGEYAVHHDPDPCESAAVTLRSAVGDLTSHQRRLIELTYVDGLTYAAAAVVLGIPVGTAKSQMRQLLRGLRLQLQQSSIQHAASA